MRAASRTGAPRDERDRGAGGGDGRAAALGVEAGVGDAVAVDGEVDAHEVAAGRAAGRRRVRAGGHVSAPAREAQMLLEALVGHPAGV